MKRILILSLAYHPIVGGAEIAIREITDRIAPADIEFHMVTLRLNRESAPIERIGHVLVHRIGFGGVGRPGKFLFQFGAAIEAWRLHRRYHYSALWAVMAHSAGVPANLFHSFHPSVPYVLTLQEGDPLDYIERLMRPLRPLFVGGFRRAAVVQAISAFLGAWARRQGFTGRLEVIPNGVDTQRFAASFPESQLLSLKRRLGKKDGDVYLVTTSRLVRKNAADDVIAALPLLPPHTHFLLLGEGPDKAMLEALAQYLGVADRVHFLGHVPYAVIPQHLRICEMFVRPSRSEGLGNSFIEAFAAGLPVVATQEGGLADIIFDAARNPGERTTAWAVDKDSPAQIAAAVMQILARPNETQQIVAHARSLALRNYDWERIADKMRRKIFGSVLADD